MFKRVILEEWHHIVPYVCFSLIAGVFALGVLYAIRMKKTDVEHLSHLPLLGDEELKEKSLNDKAENE